MFTYRRLPRLLLKRQIRYVSTQLSATSSAIPTTTHHQHELRLSMNKLIQRLSLLPLPNFKMTLNSTSELNSNANDTLRSLLILLTRRLERMSSLSYIMMMNPHMAKIWDAYLHSYNELIQFIGQYTNVLESTDFGFDSVINFKVTNQDQNVKFVQVLHDIMDMHTDNVVDLRDGIRESKKAMVNKLDDDILDDDLFAGFSEKQFLDEHLSERVLMRLLANNHILLSEGKNIGILDNNLNVLDILSRSVEFVNGMSLIKYDEKVDVIVNTRIIDENGDYKCEENIDLNNFEKHGKIIFPYIGNHIEYVLNEILKNSTRALIENKIEDPVEILIVLDKSKPGKKPTLQMKISDLGGGIRSDILEKLWEYSFTTVNDSTENSALLYTKSGKDIELGAAHDLGFNPSDSPGADTTLSDNIIAGMGYGLPLSLTYCRLFGGDIKLHSVWGQGTDVYVVLRGI